MRGIKLNSVLIKLSAITLLALVAALVVISLEVEPQPRLGEGDFYAESARVGRAIGQTAGQDLDYESVLRALREFPPLRGVTLVFDPAWNLIYNSDHPNDPHPAQIPRDQVEDALNSRERYLWVQPIWQQGHPAGYLVRRVPPEEVYGAEPAYNTMVPLRLLLAVLAFFVLAYVLTFPMRRDFKRLTEAIRRYAAGDLSIRTGVKSRDELGQLGRLLDEMASRLEAARKAEREMEEMKDQLIIGVSHDLRTPLTSVLGYLKTLREHLPASEPARRQVDIIERKAEKIKVLVDDLFRFTKLRAGDIALKTGLLDLGSLIRQVITEYAFEAEEAGRRLLVNIPDDPVMVQADGELISRVVENLLINTFKHAKGAENVEVALKTSPDRGEVEVVVVDDGEGIPRSELPHVFERFYSGNQQSDAVEAGSGLGLAIAKEIVRLHGGRIWAKSEPGRRTEFGFSLPLVDDHGI